VGFTGYAENYSEGATAAKHAAAVADIEAREGGDRGGRLGPLTSGHPTGACRGPARDESKPRAFTRESARKGLEAPGRSSAAGSRCARPRSSGDPSGSSGDGGWELTGRPITAIRRELQARRRLPALVFGLRCRVLFSRTDRLADRPAAEAGISRGDARTPLTGRPRGRAGPPQPGVSRAHGAPPRRALDGKTACERIALKDTPAGEAPGKPGFARPGVRDRASTEEGPQVAPSIIPRSGF